MLERGYRNWEFAFKGMYSVKSNEVLFMDQMIQHPWFMKRHSIVFFYEPMALAMALTNNDIDKAINIVYT